VIRMQTGLVCEALDLVKEISQTCNRSVTVRPRGPWMGVWCATSCSGPLGCWRTAVIDQIRGFLLENVIKLGVANSFTKISPSFTTGISLSTRSKLRQALGLSSTS
jgi:hypothetical protein